MSEKLLGSDSYTQNLSIIEKYITSVYEIIEDDDPLSIEYLIEEVKETYENGFWIDDYVYDRHYCGTLDEVREFLKCNSQIDDEYIFEQIKENLDTSD